MRCVVIDGSGFVVDVVPQPGDLASCSMVLASPLELQSPLTDLFSMSAADGALISVAIATCWVIGWAVGLGKGLAGARQD